jgi:hypothetical protein
MERALMVTQQRSSIVARALIAAGFAVASLSLQSAAHASNTAKHKHQEHAKVAEQASVSGPKSNPDKKAEAKAAREKKKAEKAAQRAEKLAKAKAGKKGEGEKVAKADSKPMNDDMGGSDDPLEGL